MDMCPNCGIALSKFQAFTFGNVTIAENTDLFFKGQRVEIGGQQKIIVEALIRASGRPMERYPLLDVIGCDDADHRTIDVYIRRARTCFEAIDPNFNQITTVRNLGYRWDFVKEAHAPELRLAA